MAEGCTLTSIICLCETQVFGECHEKWGGGNFKIENRFPVGYLEITHGYVNMTRKIEHQEALSRTGE